MNNQESTSGSSDSPATVGEWLAQLDPAPPPALAAELHRLLAQFQALPVVDVPEVCLEIGEQLLAELMSSGSTERATALTLLTVDALVTYAFEAASYDSMRIEQRARAAMERIAALGVA